MTTLHERSWPAARKAATAVALLVTALIVAGCGSKDTADDASDGGSRVEIGLTLLGDGNVDAGLEQLAQAGDPPAEGRVPKWYGPAIDHLLQWRHVDQADSMLSLLGPVSNRAPEFVMRTAHVARLRGLADQALTLYAKVQGDLELETTAAEEMARIHLGQESPEKALAVVQPILEQDSTRTHLREIAAECLLDLDRPAQALPQIQRLPIGPSRLSMEGEALLALGQPDSALIRLKSAIQILPSSTEVRYLLGRAYLDTRQSRPAIQLLAPLAQEDPPYRDAQKHFADALRAEGKTAQADSVQTAFEAVEHEREMSKLRFSGLQASQEGRLDDALVFLRQALALSPDDGNLHNDLGTVLARQQKYEEAEASFLRAKELRPTDPTIYLNLLRLYEAAGNTSSAEAVQAQLEALTGSGGGEP